MTYEEIKQYENKYGCLEWGASKERKGFHGTIKIVDKESTTVFFKVKGMATQKIAIKSIVGFTEKNMLGEVTKHDDKDVIWDGGILVYRETIIKGRTEADKRKEIPLKR